jgi:hypothetical protein
MVVLSAHFIKKSHLFECRTVISSGAVNRISHTPLSQTYVSKVSSINSIPSDKKKLGISLPHKLGTKMLTWRLSVHLPMYTTSILHQFRILLVEWAWDTSFTPANNMQSLIQTSYMSQPSSPQTHEQRSTIPASATQTHKHTHITIDIKLSITVRINDQGVIPKSSTNTAPTSTASPSLTNTDYL